MKFPLKLKNLNVKKEQSSSYDASSIDVLDPLDAVRKRVSMYMGSADSRAVLHMWTEAFENSIDEFSQGENDYIKTIISSEGYIIVADRGRGIPIDIKKETGNPVIIDILSKLHAGGKFGNKSYTTGTVGTHGVGITATNALSESFDVWTFRNERWWHVAFEKGKLTKKLNSKTPVPEECSKAKKGTIVKFTPDYSVFDAGSKISIAKIKEYCRLKAYVHAGIKIVLKTPKNEYEFQEKEGLKALLKAQIEGLGEEIEELEKPFILQSGPIDLAMSWTKYSGELVTSYVSGSNTREGGSHITGLYDAIRDALKPYKGKYEFTPAEARDGLVGILNVSVMQPKFSSQAKERLDDNNVTKQVYDIVKPALDAFFAANKSLVKIICTKAEALHKRAAKFTADKKSIAELRSADTKLKVATKLAGCRTKDVSKRELFLVEGDSAAGTCKEGRDKEFQMVLPLRGKILNAFRQTEKLFANEEVQSILSTVGVDSDRPEISKLKVGKIILLPDPDVDGRHIANLLLSLFQKVFPDTLIHKKIFLVNDALFTCQLAGGRKIFGASVKDVEKQVEALKKKMPPEGVQRIKGWGEVNIDTLQHIAMDKKTRRLTQIIAPTDEEASEFAAIVGEDAGERRKLVGV